MVGKYNHRFMRDLPFLELQPEPKWDTAGYLTWYHKHTWGKWVPLQARDFRADYGQCFKNKWKLQCQSTCITKWLRQEDTWTPNPTTLPWRGLTTARLHTKDGNHTAPSSSVQPPLQYKGLLLCKQSSKWLICPHSSKSQRTVSHEISTDRKQVGANFTGICLWV